MHAITNQLLFSSSPRPVERPETPPRRYQINYLDTDTLVTVSHVSGGGTCTAIASLSSHAASLASSRSSGDVRGGQTTPAVTP